MKSLLYISIIILLCTTSCRKYVEIPPENARELKETRDYQSLLNNASLLFERTYIYPIWASDDAGTNDLPWQNAQNAMITNAYTWAPKIWGQTQEDVDWQNLYKSMFTANTVITEVMASIGGTDAQKRKAYAEALVHRAYLYHTLVNIYAKQYDAATAAADPGVPVLLDNRLFANLTRWSVAAVYEQVIKDLEAALPELPDQPDFVTNPGKGAAYAMLARVYLNQRKWQDARRFADSALRLKSGLIDLNGFVNSTTGYPRKINDPEVIFSKLTGPGITTVPLSDGLMALFDTKDLRYRIYTRPGAQITRSNFTNRGYMKHQIVTDGIYVGPSVPEMMLTKAECEARLDNAAAATDLLNTLRKKRFTAADYVDVPVTNAADALQAVVAERRRELMGTGMRWFDQRRLQKDPSFNFITPVIRIFKGTTYTLPPGSNLYVFAIADRYIQLNPEIEQNPR
ncbi:MAG: RagB/SusD family nutrient uptake outer membrane protein [Niastella sp.]|nr:RagB/SusD family nutrient uptake outer membrane protein [Niastella sp.]